MEGYLFVVLIFCISKVKTETIVRFNLNEEVPARTLVGSISDSSGLRQNMTSEEFSSLQFNFLDQTSMQSLFTIGSEEGDLRTSIIIDRESECGFQEICILKFDVMAHSPVTSNFVILSVEVLLLDINDKSPVFQPSSVTLPILESAAIGTAQGVEDATDDDSTAINRIKNYQILPTDGAFELNATKKSDGSFNLKLVLRQKLDRETQSRYQIQVVAEDGGTGPNSGVLDVTINVLDDNDNPPVFEQKLYIVSINEDVSVGTSLLKVSASDRDAGENGQIEYRFNSRQAELDIISEMFTLNESNGVLSVKNLLRYDLGKVYDIHIEASDKGKQPLVDQTIVKVTVLDVKNNPPIVRINFLSSGASGVVNVSEAAKNGAVIAHVNVEDSDSGQNGNVTCTVSDVHFGLRVVQGKGYVLVINRTLDRETQDLMNVSIICSDHGQPVITTRESFLVRVSDENDKPPKFSQSTYLASISENNAVGDVVTQVSAHDLDVGQNAIIRYYLHENSRNRFAINPNTGVITANELFDRETTLYYKFNVIAVDSGNPALTGSASILVTITDTNDNSPTFDEPMFQFFVMENQKPDTRVGTLTAKDSDEGQNAKIFFRFEENSTSSNPFYILQDGTIRTNRVLDRELQSSYDFKVVAYDLGNPSRNNTTRVMIYVTDENDETPEIKFPNRVNNSVMISFMAPVGSLIAHVDAKDGDEQGRNSQLVYEFIRGNDLQIFTIGKTTGKIFLAKTYHVEADVTFPVTVSVSDMGEIPKKSSQDFHIVLKFTNESFPVPLHDNGNRNIIISAVLVALTFVISAIIVTVICIIRRNDEKTLRDSNTKNVQLYSKAPPQMVAIETMNTKEMNNIDSTFETPKKKKGVSFSLDDGDMQLTDSFSNSMFDSNADISASQQSHGNMVTPPYGQIEPIKPVHLHQLSSSGIQKPFSTHDNISDSSGEVTNSDSGRGGSDLDLTQSNRTDNFKHSGNHSPRHRSHDFPPIIPKNSIYASPIKSSHLNQNQPIRGSEHCHDPLRLNISGHVNDSFDDVPTLPPRRDKWHPSYV